MARSSCTFLAPCSSVPSSRSQILKRGKVAARARGAEEGARSDSGNYMADGEGGEDRRETVRRAAFDIGSAATKLLVAEVDPDAGTIRKVLFGQEIPVAFSVAWKSSPDGSL